MPPGAFPNPFQRTAHPPRIVAVVPARWASSRLPGKPLLEIAGRPMIEHVYRRAAAARGIDAVIVATDDERIAAAVERFGGVVRMTDAGHRTGTDRVAEVARSLPSEIVVNVQGDLPLVPPEMIQEVVEPLTLDGSVPMATLRCPIANARELADPNVVKVVVDRNGDALYFSRAPIPYVRDAAADAPRPGPAAAGNGAASYRHIGLYAYRRDFLLAFTALSRTPLEQAESLEQLRALEHGFRIRTLNTRYETIEVDTPEDLERARRAMAAVARA